MTTPTPSPSPTIDYDGFDPYWWDSTGSGTITHQPGVEEHICSDTLPTLLIPADHPDPDSVVESYMESLLQGQLGASDPGFPWETVSLSVAATLFVVAISVAGWRFVKSRRADASRPAHTVTTGDD